MKFKLLCALIGAVMLAAAAPAGAATVTGTSSVTSGGSITGGDPALNFAATDFALGTNTQGINGAHFDNGKRYFDYIFSFSLTGPADVAISTTATPGTNIFDYQTALFSSSPAGSALLVGSNPGLLISLTSLTDLVAPIGGGTVNALNLASGTYYLRLFGVITGNSDKNSVLKALSGSFAATAVVAATPIPASLPLFGGALGLIGLMGWRRKTAVLAAAA
jgi:hypothetical protein